MALNASLLRFDGTGRVRNSTTVDPATILGGTPITSTGLLSLALSAPTAYAAGIGYSSTGRICADVGGTVARFNAGLPFTSADRIACDSAAAITTYHSGLPFTAAGALAVAAAE